VETNSASEFRFFLNPFSFSVSGFSEFFPFAKAYGCLIDVSLKNVRFFGKKKIGIALDCEKTDN